MNSNFLKTEGQITAWLDKHNITEYSLLADEKYGFVVDVRWNVELSRKNLNSIPIKFNKVYGDLNCSSNELTSLEFCPREVRDFNCSDNNLSSLEFCPENIKGDFWCANNKLTSLEGSPYELYGTFLCRNNQLVSLEFCPQVIFGNFDCSSNQLKSLLLGPQTVKGDYYCDNNQLTSLEGIAQKIGGSLECTLNLLSNFAFYPNELGGIFNCSNNPPLGEDQGFYSNSSGIYEIHLEHKRIEDIKKEKQHIEGAIKPALKNINSASVHKI